MGTEMAVRLVEKGHELTVWNRSGVPDRVRDAGVRPAATPADAARGAATVITMLTDETAVSEVLLGPDGAASSVGPEAVLVDMSTVGPDAVGRIRERLPAGVRFVDAPVQGSTPKARSGELVIFASGAAADVDRCRPVLDTLGAVRFVGPLGAGSALKLVVNLVLGTSVVVIGEALQLADARGLDQAAVLDALAGTAVGPLVPRIRGRLADPHAPTQFPIRLAAKDLRLVAAAGGRPDAAVDGAARTLAAAVEAGLDDADISDVPGFVRRRS